MSAVLAPPASSTSAADAPSSTIDAFQLVIEALRLNGSLRIFELSSSSGKGLEDWFAYLRKRVGGA